MLRTIAVTTVLVAATAIGIPAQWLSLKLGLPTRRLIPMYYHRLCLWLMDVRVEVRGEPAAMRPLLFVANHSSWLDHPVLSSMMPVMFIAKQEIASWPVFGLLARLQRSIFVDRTRRQATGAIAQQISARLTGGDPVVLYGEGMRGDGNVILPFRSALLGALNLTNGSGTASYVQPVSIAYARLQGLPMGRQHRPVAAWFGKSKLTRHIGRVLRIGAIDVVVTFGPAIAVTADTNRKQLARSLEATVRRLGAAARSGRPEIALTANALSKTSGAVPLAAKTR